MIIRAIILPIITVIESDMVTVIMRVITSESKDDDKSDDNISDDDIDDDSDDDMDDRKLVGPGSHSLPQRLTGHNHPLYCRVENYS